HLHRPSSPTRRSSDLPLSPLSNITDQVTIEGYSQPLAMGGNRLIQINGGLVFSPGASNSWVGGLIIGGITLDRASSVVVSNNLRSEEHTSELQSRGHL